MIRSILWLVIGGVIMGLGLLASCASPPTQAVSGGRYGAVPIPRPKPVDTPVRTAVAPMGGMTFVKTGESLADVAARTGNTTRELIEANGLTAPFKVQPGQQLRLPVPPVHVVQAGETASSLSRRYGVSVGDIDRKSTRLNSSH